MANGPPIIPAGIGNALGSFEAHMLNGPPITVEQVGPPIIPGNPVFEVIPAAQILHALVGETTTVSIAGPPIIPAGIGNALSTFEQHGITGPPITVEQSGPPIIPGNPVFEVIPAAPILNFFFGETTTVGVQGPPIIPAGIGNALGSFEAHMVNGPPITIEQQGPPIIPGNPVFEVIPAAQIIETLFHETTTVDTLGVAALHHDWLIG